KIPTGTLMKKIQRQVVLSLIQPPRIGPQIGATSVVIDQIASASPRLVGLKSEISSACEPGIIGPETAPCSTRKSSSVGRFQAMPQKNEASVTSATETEKVVTTPKRLISQPVSGTETPFDMAKRVMIQVPWSVLTPRLPEMVGMETLAMVESSTCMKVPSA